MSRYEGPVEQVTHISITKVWEVECPQCGFVVAAESTYSNAVMARREHFFQVHKGQGGDQR